MPPPEASLRFGLRCPPCVSAAEVAGFAREMEDAGFDVAWFPDSQFLWRDVWTTAGLVADRTERIGIGVAVTNFETRHVAVTAGAVSTLHELAPGRLRIGMGTGDSAVKTLALKPTPLGTVRDRFERLRRLLAGEVVTFEGREGDASRQARVRHAPREAIPLYMAASGPKALALAGEIADGVIVLTGVAPHLVERAIGHVSEGARRGGRQLDDLDLWLAAHAAVTPDEQTAARIMKPMCLSSAQLGAGGALRSVGIDVTVPPVVSGVYPDMTHAENWEAAITAAEAYIDDTTGDRYARNFTLAGPVELIAERIETAVALGISNFYILGLSSYDLPRELLEAFAGQVLPRYANRSGAAARG